MYPRGNPQGLFRFDLLNLELSYLMSPVGDGSQINIFFKETPWPPDHNHCL